MRRCAIIPATFCWLCLAGRAVGFDQSWTPAQETGSTTLPQASQPLSDIDQESTRQSLKDQLIGLLPPSVSEDLEVDVWGWIGALHTSDNDYWDGELSVGITKTFDQRVTLSAQGNFIDANGELRAELEQGYVSALLFPNSQTLLTVGKFNANFGVEARDFWNRRTGTTSLLFGAQPQDLVGAMLTQPLGDSGVKVRPFISADFQGQFNFDQPPSGGVMVEYRPSATWNMAVTNWIGPGFVVFGGKPLESPYSRDAYGTDADAVVENWQGPNIVGERAGTLYFFEAKTVWQTFPDLTISAEYLIGTTINASTGPWGWQGFMVLGDYDITNSLHTYGRFSYLDDDDWLITGSFQTRREVSVGFGYEIFDDVEVRGEYRHDFSNSHPDVDIVSVHLTFTH